MSQRSLIVSVLALFLTLSLNSQAELPKIAPLSPETASIAKFTEVPVSYYTGVPNISIPITTLKGRSMSIPVSVSYHAGGHKVNDIASWVGLGWNLNAGGQVYRVMRQLPDDYNHNIGGGYLTNPIDADSLMSMTEDDRNFIELRATQFNEYDFEPDEFHFNFMGHSGKFMFNQNRTQANPYGEVVFFPKSDVKVEPIFVTDKIVEWKITTTDGNQYFFGQPDATSNERATDKITYTSSYSAQGNSLPAEALAPYDSFSYFTSWKLTKIVTYQKETITFKYRQQIYTNRIPTGESEIMNWEGETSRSSSKTTGSNSILEEISISGIGKIVFNEGLTAREDNSQDLPLDNIILYDAYNNQIEKIDLIQSYFQSTVPSGPIRVCDANADLNEISKRLKLDKVKFYNKDNSDSYEYEMEYNTTDLLPHRLSKAQDYWGYYNGKTDNQTLIPSMFYTDQYNTAIQDFFYEGADRTINPQVTQANMLEKLTYPEGGYTLFEYENNTAAENFDYQNSQNIFEPFTEDDFNYNSDIDPNTTSSSSQTVTKQFTIPTSVSTQLPINIITSSTVYDNSVAVSGNTHNLPQDDQDIHFFIKDSNGNTVVGDPILGVPIGYDVTANLASGTYNLEIVFDTGSSWAINPQNEEIKIDVIWKTLSFPDIKMIGGLRIKSIENYDGISTEPKTKRNYHYLTPGTSESSGWIVDVPVFKSFVVAQIPDLTLVKAQLSSNNVIPLITTQGNYVGYTSVTEERIGELQEDSQFTTFNSSFFPLESSYVGAPSTFEWESGNSTKTTYHRQIPETLVMPDPLPFLHFSIPLKEDSKSYQYNFGLYDRDTITGVQMYPKFFEVSEIGLNRIYELKNGTLLNRKSFSKEFFYDDQFVVIDSMEIRSELFYGNPNVHLNPIEKETLNSLGDTLREKYTYVKDIVSPSSEIQTLIDQNRISAPVVVESYKHSPSGSEELLSIIKTHYKDWGNDMVLQEFIETTKGGYSPEDRIQYHKYDTDNGNPLQVSKIDGIPICYIWGHNGRFPVAKIENATYAQIEALSGFGTNFTIAGNLNDSQIANLRTLLNSMVSIYNYDPSVGLTSMEDPRGYKTYYEYDEFNRLEYVLDEDDNILSKNEYNYKN